jgi:Fe-S-cluster containining protein
MDIHTLVDQARDSLSSFCSTTCKAKCCQRGKLIIASHNQFPDAVKRDDGLCEVDLTHGCPHLINHRCAIYPLRPICCKEFPVYLRYKKILISSWCMGQQQGLLDSYIKQFKQQGYEVVIV